MAGYSSTPLTTKLGIRDSMKVMLCNPPENYMRLLGVDIGKQLTDDPREAELLHLFVITREDLKKQFGRIITHANPNLVIWISWYKRSSGMATDIREEVIRETVLPAGWVDVKVCAVSDLWSGLKVVNRKENRR